MSAQTNEPSSEQSALWNGTAGQAWVEAQSLMDGMLAPFEKLLVDAVAARSARRVLDVGCGTGATTVAIARALADRVHDDARVTGIDISRPMLDVARARAAGESSPATFVEADAASYTFDAASFDLFVSRFGVMFFDDPLRAFANLKRAAKPGAETHFIAWRAADENPFMTVAERAAAPLLPSLPPRIEGGPGQFAFADPQRVVRIFEESGWKNVSLHPIDVPCTFSSSALPFYATRLGPLGRVLHEADDDTRKRVVDAVLASFRPYIDGEHVRFDAACWVVIASAL